MSPSIPPFTFCPDEKRFDVNRKFSAPLPHKPGKVCLICARTNEDGKTFFITSVSKALPAEKHVCQFCIGDMAWTLLQYKFEAAK